MAINIYYIKFMKNNYCILNNGKYEKNNRLIVKNKIFFYNKWSDDILWVNIIRLLIEVLNHRFIT
jgi:hypothetical protein